MSMVSPMLFLLNPFDQIGSEIKCVGDLLDKIKKMRTDQHQDIRRYTQNMRGQSRHPLRACTLTMKFLRY